MAYIVLISFHIWGESVCFFYTRSQLTLTVTSPYSVNPDERPHDVCYSKTKLMDKYALI